VVFVDVIANLPNLYKEAWVRRLSNVYRTLLHGEPQSFERKAQRSIAVNFRVDLTYAGAVDFKSEHLKGHEEMALRSDRTNYLKYTIGLC
jgi:hypothetical protein